MKFHEELLDRSPGSSLHSEIQHELIAAYCVGLEERVQQAESRDDARQILDAVCSRFDSECQSAPVRHTLRAYADSLLDRFWVGS